MKKLIAIAGSNNQRSINNMLIDYTSDLQEGIEIVKIDLNDYLLPIFGVDYEAENGIPVCVKRLDQLFNSADGFIVSLAEHNGSYSAVFKNTIDWLSRINMKIWKEKPMFLMATSPGGRGGATVLEAAKNYFPFMGAQIIDTFSLPSFYDNFQDCEIINENFKTELVEKVHRFHSKVVDSYSKGDVSII